MDLIDRQALLKNNSVIIRGEDGEVVAQQFIAIIRNAPTVDAVPVVHGEWNFGKFNAGSETVFIECSECAAVFDVPTFVFGLNYNYCPNCGADMRGAEDG